MTSEKSKARVTVSENGPYMVTGDIPLAKQTIMTNAEDGSEAWQEGPAVAHRETYALCRCGASQTKPFCDGSHLKIGFVGTETASRDAYLDQAKLLNGPILQLTDAESLCAFGRSCDPNGNVWSQVSQTADRGVRTMFVRQVNECPSGLLVGLGQKLREAGRTSVAGIDRFDRGSRAAMQRTPVVARWDTGRRR
ncbi:CDGSH-type Zn-finger protein [Bradyrhizobium sp. JR6.1]